MSYPNRDRRSNASRYRGTTEEGYRRRPQWEARTNVMAQARRALGLSSDRYGRHETAQGVLPDGRAVKLVPSPRTGSGRKGMLMRRIQILCDQCNQWIPAGRIDQHEGTGSCYRNRGRGRTTRDPSGNTKRMDVYSVAERAFPGCLAAGTRYDSSMGADKVFMEDRKGSHFECWVKDGKMIGVKGKGSARDPEEELNPRRIDLKPGRKNRVRRSSLNSWGSQNKQAGYGRRNLIGRRKTVSSKVGRLISRKSQKAAKRAMFRMNQKTKLLACHACNRTDFASEKSLKRHTEKFHTPGQKSPRGFRTRRDQ